MGFISDNFGSYSAYNTWRGTYSYLYHVKLVSSTETEILKINPAGILNQGKKQKRHEVYHGIFTYITVGLQFSILSGGSGDILKNEFDSNGIRGQCSVTIYKLNPTTADFDEYFTGKADFNPDSYINKIDENGARIISIDIIETGIVQKLLSRDKLELNLARNTSVGGTTITDVSTTTLTYPAINIYQEGKSNSANYGGSKVYSSSQDYTEDLFFASGTEIINTMPNRLDFSPTGGRIYTNDTSESKDIKFKITADYFAETDCGTNDELYIRYRLNVYDGTDTFLTGFTLEEFSNIGVLGQINTGTIDYNTGYTTVPVNGYVIVAIEVKVVYSTLAQIITMSVTTNQNYEFYEKSLSIGATTATTYNVYQAFLKLCRLCTDTNDCFQSTYLTDLSANGVADDYITSGRNLRNFPNNWVVTSFRDLFEHVQSIWPIMMSYDGTRFYIEELDEAYQDVEAVDFGVVNELELVPDCYYNKLLTGYNQEGKLEEHQGALMFNLKAEHSLSFEYDSQIDLRGKYHMSGIEFEIIRRQQYEDTGLTDNDQDKDIFYAWADQYNIVTQCIGFEGWEGIAENYNPNYTPRQNLLRNKWLKGLFRYDSGEYIRFVSNQKNVAYTYGSVDETDDISQTDLATSLYYPEKQTFNAAYTPAIRAAIEANIHGYYKITDKSGIEYYGYWNDMEVQDFEQTIKVIGKTKL